MGLVLKREGWEGKSLHLVKKKWKGVTHRLPIVPLLIRPRGERGRGQVWVPKVSHTGSNGGPRSTQMQPHSYDSNSGPTRTGHRQCQGKLWGTMCSLDKMHRTQRSSPSLPKLTETTWHGVENPLSNVYVTQNIMRKTKVIFNSKPMMHTREVCIVKVTKH